MSDVLQEVPDLNMESLVPLLTAKTASRVSDWRASLLPTLRGVPHGLHPPLVTSTWVSWNMSGLLKNVVEHPSQMITFRKSPLLFNIMTKFLCCSHVTERISFTIEFIQLRKFSLNDTMYAKIAFVIYNGQLRGSCQCARGSALGSSSGIYRILCSVSFLFL